MWLLVLLTPVNLLFSVQAGFEVPTGNILWPLILGGAIIYAAQRCLTLACAAADAAYVQPFDDLKLFSIILVPWLVLSYAPDMTYWPGILIFFAGSAYLLWSERDRTFGATLA